MLLLEKGCDPQSGRRGGRRPWVALPKRGCRSQGSTSRGDRPARAASAPSRMSARASRSTPTTPPFGLTVAGERATTSAATTTPPALDRYDTPEQRHPDSATHPGRLRRWGAIPMATARTPGNAFRDRKGARGDTAGAHHAGSLGRRPARCEAVPFTPARHASHRRRRSNPSSRRLQPVPPVALKRWAGPGLPTRRHRESALTRSRRRTAKVPWRRLDRADE